MIIQQNEKDDSVLSLRVRSLCKYIVGLFGDRPMRELPDGLRAILEAADAFAAQEIFPGIDFEDSSTRFHGYLLLEVISKEFLWHPTIRELDEALETGKASFQITEACFSAVPCTVMEDIKLDHGDEKDARWDL